MKNLPTLSVIAILILLAAGFTMQVNAQRCGGDVVYFVRDKKGEIIDADKVALKYVRRVQDEHDTPAYDEKDGYAERETLKGIRFVTACGIYMVEIALESEGRQMLLRFHNLPMETNFFVDSIPFHEGVYEIDFKREIRLNSQILNRDGLKTKDGNYLFSSYAKYDLLVSAKNWTKTSSRP